MKQHNYTFWNNQALAKLILVLPLLLYAFLLRGQTQYIGANGGDWSTSANWNNGLPSASNLPTITGSAVVCINGSLTIDYTVTNYGSIVNKGTTSLSGTIISGGLLENQGTFHIENTAIMNSGGGFVNSGVLNNQGNVTSNSAFENVNTGVFTNFATWLQYGTVLNDGSMTNSAGNFTCTSAFMNNNSVHNGLGATWKMDFGSTFTNTGTASLTNLGSFQNIGTFNNNNIILNSGTFTNNVILNCNGNFDNESGGNLTNTGTINLAAQFNNKAGASVVSSNTFNVLPNGYVQCIGGFTNGNVLDIQDTGTFNTDTGASVVGTYGSTVTNGGYFRIAHDATVTTNGTITNTGKMDIYGLYDAMNGGNFINTSILCSYGSVKNVSVINNSGFWKNLGLMENNSGGVWTNTGSIENFRDATISNNYEIRNKPMGIVLNNGTLNNIIRVYNEGTFTNNAYFLSIGAILNLSSGSFINTEVLVIREGSIQNSGILTNQKTLINESCSTISNTGTINNTGRFENRGLIFQKGTVTGTPILELSGYIHTNTTSSNAPAICKTELITGTDANGEAKVYGQSGFLTTISLDECSGFQYSANDVARYIYYCNTIGVPQITHFKIITQTGDSLTCDVPTTVFDNVAPVVNNCPRDATVYTTQNSAVYTWAAVTGIDNCGDVPTVTESIASGSTFALGTTQVTISVKDSRNTSTDCIFKINVVKVFSTSTCPSTDAVAPVFANCPTNQTVNTVGNTAAVVWNTPSVSDDCYPVVVQQNLNSGTFFPIGTNTVSYTAKDPTGNISNCAFTVTVEGATPICESDNIKPVIANCPPNFFGTLNPAILGAVGYWKTPTATDNCNGSVSLTTTAVSGTVFNVGTTNIVYTATDAHNNTSTCQFTVFVENTNPCLGDITPPTLTCPANISINTTNTTAVATWTAPNVSDACSPVTLNSSHQPNDIFANGTTAVIYCASDKIGNTSKCAFTVTISNPCGSDTQAPVLAACPANQTVTATANNFATATWVAPTATDNCTLAGVTSNYTSGSNFPVGTTTVVYTATDITGNQATCSFSIVVNNDVCVADNTPPIFASCPINQTNTASSNCLAATWTTPTASDNCTLTSLTFATSPTVGLTNGGCFPIGTTTVTYTATDANNNQSTCYFNITITPNCTTLTNTAATEYYINNTWYTGSSVTVNAGASLTLSANPNGLVSYQWTGPNGFSKTGNAGGDVLVASAISTAQAGSYTVVLTDANGCTATKSILVNVVPSNFSMTNCGGNGEQLLLKGSIDYIAIGNTMSQAEDRSNCNKNSNSSKILTLPVGAVVKAAYLYWSGSGTLDNSVLLNGNTVVAQGSKTFYEPSWGMSFFGARANVTNLVQNSGTFTVSGLTWNNTGNYCYANSAYGAWSMVVVYEKAGLTYSTIHINTDNFRMTFPANTYSRNINCINIPSGCASNAKMTIIAFEGDNYKGENLFIGGVNRGNNNFRGQSGPNLDILTFDVSNVVYAGKTFLNYSIQSYLTYTIWGSAVEGLFDYVKVLKYNSCAPTANFVETNTVLEVQAKAEANRTRVEWVNNTGYKNDFFTVEKMDNTTNSFRIIETKNAQQTDVAEHYTAYDNAPTEGDNFYRIGLTYYDGTTKYSETQKVTFASFSNVRVFPNPASDILTIDLTAYEGLQVDIEIYSAMGQLVNTTHVEKATTKNYEISIGDIPTGSYLMRILPEGKRYATKQIIISR